MSALVAKQQLFARCVGMLLRRADDLGYGVTLGHAYRCDDCKVGHARSLHKSRLAIDLHLWKDGQLLTGTADYWALGQWWESVGGTWGGRFDDGCHFSFEHDGMV